MKKESTIREERHAEPCRRVPWQGALSSANCAWGKSFIVSRENTLITKRRRVFADLRNASHKATWKNSGRSPKRNSGEYLMHSRERCNFVNATGFISRSRHSYSFAFSSPARELPSRCCWVTQKISPSLIFR